MPVRLVVTDKAAGITAADTTGNINAPDMEHCPSNITGQPLARTTTTDGIATDVDVPPGTNCRAAAICPYAKLSGSTRHRKLLVGSQHP